MLRLKKHFMLRQQNLEKGKNSFKRLVGSWQKRKLSVKSEKLF